MKTELNLKFILNNGAMIIDCSYLMVIPMLDHTLFSSDSFSFTYLDLLLFALVLLVIFFSKRLYFSRHKHNIKKAKKILKKINTIENQGAIISYLRKIDPFVFEELLLEAFKNKEYQIKRNKRYTGDGGIDGQVMKNGNTYLVQAKRYSSYVDPKHLEEFSQIIRRRRSEKGFFIHTGKTGKSNFSKFSNVKIISGESLIRLLKNIE